MFTGGHKYRNDDVTTVQNGVIEAFEGICKAIGLNQTTYILQGCTWDYLGGLTYTVNAGFIYHNGVIYPVDAHTPTYVGNTLYWVVVTKVLSPSPVTYGDASTHDCHIRERMELRDLAAPPVGTYVLESNTCPYTKYVGITPQNGIIMYSGSVADFSGSIYNPVGTGNRGTPVEGWALCNGANTTPDLRGRFIVGYDSTDTDYNAIGKTGGSKTKDLRHRHEAFRRDPTTFLDSFFKTSDVTDTDRRNSLDWKFHQYATGAYNFYSVDTLYSTAASGEFYSGNPEGGVIETGDTGSDLSQKDIRPPYYTLAYIMKL